MSRNNFRDGSQHHPKPAPVLAVKNERGFKLQMDIKDIEDQMDRSHNFPTLPGLIFSYFG